MSTDPSAAAQRRGALLGAKLRTLVADRTGTGVPDDALGPTGLGVGVGLVADGVAWVLLDAGRSDGLGLGPALAWAVRQGAQRVVVLGDHDLGVVARRAALFDMPVEVLQVDGREVTTAVAAAPPGEAPVADEHLTFRDLVVAAGAEPVPAESWRRAVDVVTAEPIDLAREPRIKPVAKAPLEDAKHPFFWAGYMLVDCRPGIAATADAEALRKDP